VPSSSQSRFFVVDNNGLSGISTGGEEKREFVIGKRRRRDRNSIPR
jgi:hypothetical protein